MRTHSNIVKQGIGLWQPNWDALQVANARLYEGLVVISEEWRAFLSRRVEEDLRSWEELAAAKTPEELWSAYGKFWQKALEDYGNGYLTLSQLYAKLATSGRTAPQPALRRATLHSRAAWRSPLPNR